MGVELLLMDQKSSVIHAFIPANRLSIYEAALKAGAVYVIQKFLVLDNKKSYRVTSHKFLIQFTMKTTMVEAD
ncbi:unnamed protein product [Microthlaspi erraticum]|uniref:Replication protein A 70 kDa DNA-binding subunit B/D first OB fold domain-containing protein n=1 Tax=Microthlaspi erraticum TaxID=1685480 RepID=A0A6D2JFF4_9BRAS|nr:unnamed protein product [Microthlaspi erraticum]